MSATIVIGMKVIITAMGNDLNSQVDPRFGRCKYFLTVDTETMEFEATPNGNQDAMGGVGVQAAQTVANKGVDALLTGSVGPNAFQTLSAAGLKIYTGAHGTIKEVLEQFKQGELKESSNSTVGSHSGMRNR
jgi:predicted Fe-Mo cluster-binding NifX family protein